MKNNNYAKLLLIVLLACSACDSKTEQEAALYPRQDSSEFQVFAKQCSSCHRPPMPDVHTAQAWTRVIARMQQHKEQRGLLVMNAIEQQTILDYLQKHAQKDQH
ncbi:MAG: hypothetical protein Q9M20_05080 [Mariprofundaceae bacterium]|nr:hypothetical protein [Mariprofundaceae bacterium]